jgi:hypothetical protein
MAIYRFPSESGKEDSTSNQEKRFEGKLPDYIYVDEKSDEKTKGDFGEKYFTSLNNLNARTYPFALRLMTLFGAIILGFWMFLLGACLGVLALVSAVFFFQWKELNQLTHRFSKIVCRLFAISLSLLVATWDPAFGFGIILLYFMLQGEKLETGFMGRILKKQFGPSSFEDN